MSVSGDWKVTMNSPMGKQEGTLTLAADGDSLTGQLDGAQGTLAIEGGSIAGDKLSWNINMTSPMPITLEFTASVNGDEISGDIKLGAFGNADFQGTRA